MSVPGINNRLAHIIRTNKLVIFDVGLAFIQSNFEVADVGLVLNSIGRSS